MEKWVGLCSPSVCFTVLGTALPNEHLRSQEQVENLPAPITCAGARS